MSTDFAKECITVDSGWWNTGVPGDMRKVKMACSCAVDGCDKDCAVLDTADEKIDIEWEWHMLVRRPPDKIYCFQRALTYLSEEAIHGKFKKN